MHFNYNVGDIHANTPQDFLSALSDHRRDIADIFKGLQRDGYLPQG